MDEFSPVTMKNKRQERSFRAGSTEKKNNKKQNNFSHIQKPQTTKQTKVKRLVKQEL